MIKSNAAPPRVLRKTFKPVVAVQQSYKDECDINFIVKRYGNVNNLPRPEVPPVYLDVYDSCDYYKAQSMLNELEEVFYRYPSEVRDRFDRDIGKMVAFAEDPRNAEEAARLGFIKPPTLPTISQLSPDNKPNDVSTE